MQTDSKTDKQTDLKTDKQTDLTTGMQTDIQSDMHTRVLTDTDSLGIVLENVAASMQSVISATRDANSAGIS